MKFLSRFFLAAICFFSASSNLYAQFVLDIPEKEFRQKIGEFTVDDLSVGQTAWVSLKYCLIGQNIFIAKKTSILEKGLKYSIAEKIKLEPDNMVSVTLFRDADNRETKKDYLARFARFMLDNCPTQILGTNAFIKVKSINGATTMSELMNTELK